MRLWENDEDNSASYKQGVECWNNENHGNHESDENHENPGCRPRGPQTTGLEIPDDWPQQTKSREKIQDEDSKSSGNFRSAAFLTKNEILFPAQALLHRGSLHGGAR